MTCSEYICTFAEMGDIDDWMSLVNGVKDNFPGLNLDEYKNTLIKNIARQSAVCVKLGDEIAGVLLFSLNAKTLSCMAVHPAHRQRGIGSALIKKLLEVYPKNSELWVSTFRDDDPLGNAPRALYKKFGFVEKELTVEFNYLNQKFVLYT